jgi:hypothetical protein
MSTDHEHPGRMTRMAGPDRRRLADAALLGACSGLRTFAGVGALAVRTGFGGRYGRVAILGAAAGELVGDKLPMTPARVAPPALAGRVVGATVAGNHAAGAAGAAAAAMVAVAAAGAAHRGRTALAERVPAPDAALGAVEDALAYGVAAAASRSRPAPSPIPRAEPSSAPGAAAARIAGGLAAATVGTAAMTLSQVTYQAASGAKGSGAPGRVGQRLLASLGIRVPRRRRPALNHAMHWLYGTAWGLPLAAVGARARRAPLATGAGVGLAVWAVSLVELPLLGVAEPAWRQSPEDLADDVAFHVIYGMAAAAALGALDPARPDDRS